MNFEEPIKVLDHGYVKYVDGMGSDESIIEAARMSTNKGFEGWEKDFNLLEFLWRNKHATPFEMCELALEVQAPIVVFREWHRHRTQSYNELSARYTQMPNIHYLPKADRIQTQSKTNKQGSAEPVKEHDASQVLAELEREQQEIYGYYEGWVEAGIAKEVARLNTPVSRYSRMRVKTDLRNWLAFCNLRMRPNAQWEIRQFANAVGEILKTIWPRTWGLFEEYDLYGASFGRLELKILRQIVSDYLGKFDEDPEALKGLHAYSDGLLKGSRRDDFLKKVLRGGLEIL